MRKVSCHDKAGGMRDVGKQINFVRERIKEDIMASTTYEHFVDANKMYAAQEQFRHVTKMGCGRFRDLTKTYHLGNANEMVTFCHRFAVIGNMVRNAGELPQPFWLGAACGGGSCSAARCAART